jgi:hypothetical protein
MNALAESLNLSPWQNFYVIVGSSSGALVGLQFVVIALIVSARHRTDVDSINAFGTPTVVHFSTALTISAIMCAPLPSLLTLSIALALCGLVGLVCACNVFRRARRQTAYTPVREDWVWYGIVPSGIYVALVVAALSLGMTGRLGLSLVAAATLSLLLVGIRNAWDTVTHIVATGHQSDIKTSE